jgi:tRNA pseudouridine55 synthase
VSANGLLIVDKPAGPTSHDVVDRVREVFGQRRAGHTGTLDPFATGVLPVCLGKATRLARFLAEGDKAYSACVRLGFATTTDDLTGETLGELRAVAIGDVEVREACRRFTGEILQSPPAYSAKRMAGRRLYELARRGEAVAPQPVRVHVRALEVLRVDGERVDIAVVCSAGTYLRALARDLGEALGVGGHLVALRRTRSSGFGLERAVRWDDLATSAHDRLIPLAQMLPELPAVRVGADGLTAVRHGRDLGRARVEAGFPETPPPRVRVLDETGSLVALAVPRGFGFAAPGLSVEPLLHPDVVLLD